MSAIHAGTPTVRRIVDLERELAAAKAKIAELERDAETVIVKEQFERECSDGDKILSLFPKLQRTEGGSLPVVKIVSAICEASAARKRAEQRRDEAVAAFKQYGRHEDGCRKISIEFLGGVCDCGFDEVTK